MAAPRDFFVLLIARGAQLLLALLAVRFSTTILSVEQYGVLALLTGFTTFFGLFLVNPVGQYINRHTHEWFEEKLLLAQLRRFNEYIVVVSIIAVALVASWFYLRAAMDISLVWIAASAVAAMVYAGTWNATLVPMLNMVGRPWASVGIGTLTTLLALTCSVILALGADSASLWLAGQVVGLGAGAIVALHVLRGALGTIQQVERSQVSLNKAELWKFCAPLAVATGFMWMLNSGYRFVVEWGWGGYALGLMVAGLIVVNQLWLACESLAIQFLFPHFYKAISDGSPDRQQQAYSNLVNILAPVYLLLLGATVACAGWLVAVLTDAKFHDAYIYAMFGGLIEWCRAMTSLLSQAAQATKKTAAVIVPYALSGTIAVGGGIGVHFMHGPLESVAAVLMVAGVVLLWAMRWQMNKLLPANINWPSMMVPGLVSATLLGFAVVVGFGPRSVWESAIALSVAALIVGATLVFSVGRNPAYLALLSVPLNPAMEKHD